MSGGVLANLRGVIAMLALRPGWRRHFDISAVGFWTSFSASLYAAPFFALTLASQNAVSGALAADPQAAPSVGIGHALLLYAGLWACFPLVTRIFVRFFELGPAWAPWVTVHNWTVLVLLGAQGIIGTLLLTGLIGAPVWMGLSELYFMFAIYAHCRVAIGALQAPLPVALGGAGVALLIWMIVQLMLALLFSGSAPQA